MCGCARCGVCVDEPPPRPLRMRGGWGRAAPRSPCPPSPLRSRGSRRSPMRRRPSHALRTRRTLTRPPRWSQRKHQRRGARAGLAPCSPPRGGRLACCSAKAQSRRRQKHIGSVWYERSRRACMNWSIELTETPRTAKQTSLKSAVKIPVALSAMEAARLGITPVSNAV